MKYQDTLLKDIKWKAPCLIQIDNGRLELTMTVSVGVLLEAQAQYSFGAGIAECVDWLGTFAAEHNGLLPTEADVVRQCEAWGLGKDEVKK